MIGAGVNVNMLMLFGGGGASALPLPLHFASTNLYWLDARFVTSGGDGTEVTAATDQAKNGTPQSIAKVAAGGPTYRATGLNGGPALEFAASKGLSSVGGQVSTFLNGQAAATKEWEVFVVGTPRHHLAAIGFSWSKASASSRGMTFRTKSNAYKFETYGGTSAGAQATTDASSSFHDHGIASVFSIRLDSGFLIVEQDGVPVGSPVAWGWTGNHDTDTFGVGVQDTTADVFGNLISVASVSVHNRKLTAQERSDTFAYLAQQFAFKHKVAPEAAGDWLVIAMLGQSNMVGYGTNQDIDYTLGSDLNAFYLALDGSTKPIVMDTGDGANDVSAVLAFATPTAASMVESVRARLRALGETRKLLFVPCAQISTDSVAWKAGIASSPPSANDLIGLAKHRIRNALKAPGASLAVFIDQGEANCDNGTEAAAWDPDWDIICDQLNTDFSGSFDKTAHYPAGRLSLNISGVGASTAALRAAQDAWVAGRSDALLIQRPDGTDEATPGLHLTGPEQQAYGVLMANAWYSAT